MHSLLESLCVLKTWGLIFEGWGVIFDAWGFIFEAWASKMNPWASKRGLGGHKGAHGTESPTVLGDLGAHFWRLLGLILVTFFDNKNNIFSDVVLRRSGSIWGSISEAFGDHFGSFFGPRGHSERKRRLSTKAYKTSRFC